MAEQTYGSPIGAFLRGFQNSRDAAVKQEQQAAQNQLTEQLRQIQLLTAQRQLADAMKTPEQLANEKLNTALLNQAVEDRSLVRAPIGLEGQPIALPQPIAFTADQLQAAESQGNLNDLMAQIQANKKPMQFEMPAPGAPGFLISPAAAAAEVARKDAIENKKLDSAFGQFKRENLFKKALEPIVAPKVTFEKIGNTLIKFRDGEEFGRETIPEGNKVIETKNGAFTGNPDDPSSYKLIKGTEPQADATGKPLPGDITFKTNVDTFNETLKELKDTVIKHGNYELFNSDGSAKLGALPYQIAIQYAKIVDPESVAREGEVKAAQKYLIPLTTINGFGIPSITRDATTLAAIDNMEKTVKNYSKNRATSREMFTGKEINGNSNTPSDGKLKITEIP